MPVDIYMFKKYGVGKKLLGKERQTRWNNLMLTVIL